MCLLHSRVRRVIYGCDDCNGGFNHSIADWFYIGSEPINFLKWFLVICGNFIGGYLVATK